MTIMLLCFAIIIIAAFAWRVSRVPIRHRWRRRQARVMCDAFCGRDRSQPPVLLHPRLRTMDGSSRDVVARHAAVEIVSGRQLLALVTGGAVIIGGRVL